MEGNNCGEEGGWTRIGFVNMSEPGTTCPTGLTEGQYDNITLCGLNHTVLNGTYDPVCNSTFFSTYGLNYSKVCGQVRGYQYGYAEGFYRHYLLSYNFYDPYLTGESITYDDNPIKHIWSYVSGFSEYDYINDYLDCPCIVIQDTLTAHLHFVIMITIVNQGTMIHTTFLVICSLIMGWTTV